MTTVPLIDGKSEHFASVLGHIADILTSPYTAANTALPDLPADNSASTA